MVLLLAVSGQALAGVDVTTVQLISQASTTQNEVPVTFGQAFGQGEVESSANFGARLSDGTLLPIQVDKKTAHADGTLRHAVVTLRVPSLAAGQDELVILSAEPSGGAGDPVTLEQLLATSFEADVSIDIGGTTYRASARELLQTAPRIEWLKGELVSEWIVGGPIMAGDSAHPHLAAYFHVRAYAGMDAARVDVVVENNWSHEPSPNDFTYSYTIDIGGSTVDSGNVPHHANHARWHKAFWWKRSPQVYVRHGHVYLQASRALPKYRPVTPSEATLEGLRDSVEPMGNGDMRTDFTTTGYDPQIGPLPKWAALYAISGDRRAFRSTLANGDAGGSYSIHYRDKNTGYPLSLAAYPRAWVQPGFSDSLPSGGSSLYTHDIAHQPSIAYVPYLLTGDYFYLEELQFWANYNMLWMPPDSRQEEKGLFGSQVRSQAWALRTLGQAAYATPDSHPLKAYFVDRVVFNVQQYLGLLDKNIFGILTTGYGLEYDIGSDQNVAHAPWQDDFLTFSIGRLVELGFAQAQPLLEIKAQNAIGRMMDPDYCYIVAAGYTRRFRDSSSSPVYDTWAELFAKNYPELSGLACGGEQMAQSLGLAVGEMVGRSGNVTSYVANFYPALSMAIDSGNPGGWEAWTFIESRTNKPTEQQWGDEPEWAVMPRSIDINATMVSLVADPETVEPGGSSTLRWSSTNATSCSASRAWSGSKAISGRQSIGPIDADSTFTLTCTGDGGSASDSITVEVSAGDGTTPPSADADAEPPVEDSGGGGAIGLLSLLVLASGRWRGRRVRSA